MSQVQWHQARPIYLLDRAGELSRMGPETRPTAGETPGSWMHDTDEAGL